ncbi:MAG: glycine cleavage system protein GcvH [Methylococcaceae bacterium]
MTKLPKNLKYSPTHEWALLEDDNLVRVGITDFAQGELGDVVYLELPEKGRKVKAGEACAVIESIKSASDIHSPLSGEIADVNESLTDEPEQINNNAYQNWLFCIKPDNLGELEQLFASTQYQEQITE